MSEIVTQTVNITTTGVGGAATGSGTTLPVKGFLLDVYLNYHGSAPATTDVTISDPVFGNIVVKSNSATDIWLAPRKQACDQAATAVASYEMIPTDAALTISIAQSDALADCLVATVRWLIP